MHPVKWGFCAEQTITQWHIQRKKDHTEFDSRYSPSLLASCHYLNDIVIHSVFMLGYKGKVSMPIFSAQNTEQRLHIFWITKCRLRRKQGIAKDVANSFTYHFLCCTVSGWSLIRWRIQLFQELCFTRDFCSKCSLCVNRGICALSGICSFTGR